MTDVGTEALDFLTVKEVAARLRLSVKTVRRLIYAERRQPGTGLESVKIGDNPLSQQAAVRVAPEAVIAYKKRLRDAAQASAAPDTGTAA
jgi:Helix-turn-helix domain